MIFKSKLPAIPYVAWVAIFIVIPLLLIAYFAFTDTFDFVQYAHILALDAVNYFKANNRYGHHTFNEGQYGINSTHNPHDFPQGYLNTYITSASFVEYLLELGSKDDFMRLYVDTSAAEELYGKSFDALYEQWLEFLTQL